MSENPKFLEVKNPVIAVVSGGNLQAVYADRPLDVVVIDHDYLEASPEALEMLARVGIQKDNVFDGVANALGGAGEHATFVCPEHIVPAHAAGSQVVTRDSVHSASSIACVLGGLMTLKDRGWVTSEGSDIRFKDAICQVADALERLDLRDQIDWSYVELNEVLDHMAEEILSRLAVQGNEDQETDWAELVASAVGTHTEKRTPLIY